MGSPKKPNRKSAPDDDRRLWTQPALDQMLNAMLQVNDPAEFVRACKALSGAEDRGTDTKHSPMSGAEPVKMKLWKLATRYDATDYQATDCRIDRKGMLFTWMEKDMLDDAFNPTKDGAARERPPTVQYIARLLNRSVWEIKNWWNASLHSSGLMKRIIPEE